MVNQDDRKIDYDLWHIIYNNHKLWGYFLNTSGSPRSAARCLLADRLETRLKNNEKTTS